MAAFEHPQVALPVVHGPQGLGFDRTGRQIQHHGANLPLVLLYGGVAAHQSGHAEGEEQPVFIEKIQRDQAVALAQEDGTRGVKPSGSTGMEKAGGCDGPSGSRSGSIRTWSR